MLRKVNSSTLAKETSKCNVVMVIMGKLFQPNIIANNKKQ